jgi:hypothetical protein
MTPSGSRGLLVLGFTVVVLLTASQIDGQQQPQGQRVKLTVSELNDWRSKDAVYAGINQLDGCAFLVVVSKAGYAEQSWNCPTLGLGDATGTFRVLGDQLCTKYEKHANGQERCWDVYRVGGIKYEYWLEGKHHNDIYKLK